MSHLLSILAFPCILLNEKVQNELELHSLEAQALFEQCKFVICQLCLLMLTLEIFYSAHIQISPW